MQRLDVPDGEGRRIRIRNGEILFKITGSETEGQVGIFEQTMQKGDPGPVPHFHKKTTEMFFILLGQVDIIVDEKLMFVIKTLQVGDFVGEGALFQGKGKRGAACCARTSCETMVLSKDGFAHVLQLWPDIEQELLDASKKRQEDTQLVVNALERQIQRNPKIGDSGRERPSRLRANSVAPGRRLSLAPRPRVSEAGGSRLQGSK